MARTEKQVVRLIDELLRTRGDGMPGMQVIREVQKHGVDRGSVSRAIAHSVARGHYLLDGQHRLTVPSNAHS